MSTPSNHALPQSQPWGSVALAAAGLLWAYWSTLGVLSEHWTADPLYSHGFLVPFVAAGIAWWRRDGLVGQELRPDLGLGFVALLVGIGMRLTAARFYFEWFDGLSIVPCVAGLVLMCGGRALFRCVWPAVVFLVFMVPLPFSLEVVMSGPLQSIATAASTYALQTLGYPAGSEGNVIVINEARIGVAEACSGLRMLVVFFAATAAVALCSRKPMWERCVVLLSALPIAIVCNVIRITATGVMYEAVGGATAKAFFHDFAGWLMMLLAVGFLRFELWFWSRLLIEQPDREVVPIGQHGRQGKSGKRATEKHDSPEREQVLQSVG